MYTVILEALPPFIYLLQKNMDIVIARLTRSYGPTMLMSDTKAIGQFIKKVLLVKT